MIGREGFTWEEFQENVDAVKRAVQDNSISLDEARRHLARLGFNATEIEEELKDVS